jgi:RimJ/RimL family protein N-acetyltransferase/acyl carrier protein
MPSSREIVGVLGLDGARPTPKLQSRHVQLRAVRPADYPFLYNLSVGNPSAFRWRFRERQPSFEEFINSSMRSTVFCDFLVEEVKPHRAAGYAVCYRADFRNRHASIALQGIPELEGRGVLVEAGELLIDYLFGYWDFEKLCAECPEFNLGVFKSGLGGLFSEEGCLRNHERFLGRFWDLYLLAVHRDTWEERGNAQVHRHEAASVLSLDEMGRAVTFSVFVGTLRDEFQLAEGVTGDVRLSDLGFDSIQVYELICLIEEVSGAIVEDQELESLRTIDDAYSLYLEKVTR